jgi:hypothetical protein
MNFTMKPRDGETKEKDVSKSVAQMGALQKRKKRSAGKY